MDVKIDTALSIIDVFIVLVLLWAIYKGYKRGPVIHAVSLFIIIIGIVLFGMISTSIAEYAAERWQSISFDTIQLIVFAILFIALLWLSHFVSNKIEASGTVKPKGVGSFILGVLVSVIKYVFILSVFLLYLDQFDTSYDMLSSDEKSRTKLYTTVKTIAPSTIKTISFLKE